MQSGFVKLICQMGIFMICAQAIVHFRPKASYEKYLKMLVSAMMLIQMFLFVGGIFSKDGQAELAARVSWFADSLEENTFFSEEDWEIQILKQEEPQADENGKGAVSVQEIVVEVAPIAPIRIENGE